MSCVTDLGIDESIGIGKHVLLNCWGDISRRDGESLADLMVTAAEGASATVLHQHSHRFGEGQGVSAVLVLAESHISVHTWPEYGYAAFDVFMCGDCDPVFAANYIAQQADVAHHDMQCYGRGTISDFPNEQSINQSHLVVSHKIGGGV